MTTGGVRRIILCADDYGLSPGVNAAIRSLVARGRLNATSAMVVARSLTRTEAAALAALKREAPHLQIGLHFTLTEPFAPLTPGYAPLNGEAFLPLAAMLGRAVFGRLDQSKILPELHAQIEAFIATFGFAPDYVDGHQHVQVFPQVREAVLAVMREALPGAWVRQCGRVTPLSARLGDGKGMLLDLLSAGFRKRAQAAGVPFNAGFAGTYAFGAAADFATLFPRFLDRLPDGSVVMCHPGFVDDELKALDPLTNLREREYEFLASNDFLELLNQNRVTLS